MQRIYEPSPFHSTPRLPLPLRRRAFQPVADTPPSQFPPTSSPMIAVQKPPSFFSPPAFRPMHVRHPSAPVVVRPSLTPGVLNIAKPVHTVPRAQQPSQAQPRAPRAFTKCKPQQRSPQPAHAQAVSVEKTKAPSFSPANAEQSLTSPDKSTRGRKQHKQLKDAAPRLVFRSTDVWRPRV